MSSHLPRSTPLATASGQGMMGRMRIGAAGGARLSGLGSAWAALVMVVCAVAAGCSPRIFAADAATSGDSPSVNQATSAPVENVPFCPGGNRGAGCLLGANCRVTEAGCQVCQCLSPP